MLEAVVDTNVLVSAFTGGRVTAHAQVIVTGDRDLLALHPFRGIDIITPRAFLSRLS